jgi:hypothetical protein
MSTRYRVKAPIPALLIAAEGQKVSVTIPRGAMLRYLSRPSIRLEIAHVFWEGKEYAISEEEYAELVERA